MQEDGANKKQLDVVSSQKKNKTFAAALSQQRRDPKSTMVQAELVTAAGGNRETRDGSLVGPVRARSGARRSCTL